MEDFDSAYLRLVEVAYRVAFTILGDRLDSEDVAAETMVAAFLRWAKVSQRDPVPWVVTVAARKALDVARARGRHRRKLAGLLDRDTSTDDPFAAERADLRRALLALPRRQREVAVMRHVAGLSERETAEALGITEGTVKTHNSRAMSALRILLEEA